ncbi:MAG: hypothetical protein JRI23_13335 [Deltaproteobacteria bacterium]|nr:hypothetical protein [Deltaproteobacteria bacterium]MBW2532707.1 hypothetical protein [Deltaproteobacteria bacterium]
MSTALAGTAWADALPPPPACPPGARGKTTHAGPRCAPAPCTSDADCKEQEIGGSCKPWRVCTRSTEVPPHRRGRPGGTPTVEQVVVGSCAPAHKCSGDEEPPPPTVGELLEGKPSCQEGKFCVPGALPPLPTGAPGGPGATGGKAPSGGKAGCGSCAIGRPSRDGGLPPGWLAPLAVVALRLRRKR